MPDPKPCPFCGVAAQRYPYGDDFCRCPDPDCPGHYWSKIHRWNTRSPAPPAGREQELKAEVDRVRNLIALDRTGLGAGLAAVQRIVSGYQWIPAGEWSSYSYEEQTEDALRREVGDAFDRIAGVVRDTLRASGDRADVAFRPELEPKKLLKQLRQTERERDEATNELAGRDRRIAELEDEVKRLTADATLTPPSEGIRRAVQLVCGIAACTRGAMGVLAEVEKAQRLSDELLALDAALTPAEREACGVPK